MGNQTLRDLDKHDHVIKRGGGKTTHGGPFIEPELQQRAKSEHSGAKMKEPVGPASSGNYGPPHAGGAHGAKNVAPHKYNRPAMGKKLDK